MAGVLTDEQLREIRPPAGDIGDRQYNEFDSSLSVAPGAVNASAARLVALIRRCLLEGWWQAAGTHSPEHFVMARCAVDRGRANRLVRIARELGDYPTVAGVFAAGQLTEDHVHTIVTTVDPAREAEVAESVSCWNIAQLRRLSANFPKPVPEPEPEPTPEPDDNDEPAPPRASTPPDVLAFGWNDQGRFTGRFDLGGENGSLLEKTLAAARARLFTERSGADPDDDDAMARVGSVTWAAALERLLHAAMAGLDPATVTGQRPSDRYQVLLHLDAHRLEYSRIHLGPVLSAAQRRFLTCDADLRFVLHEAGQPVSMGRRKRTVGPLLRALIEDRDRGCRNCGRTGFVHVHHIEHWEDGGPTNPENLCCLCPTCHRQVHAGDLRILGDPTTANGLVFTDRRGRPLPRPGPLPPPEPPPRARPYPGPHRGRPMPGAYRIAA